MIFEYKGQIYPDYIKSWDGMSHILATANHFCKGEGLDIGGGKWPLPGAQRIDQDGEFSATNLPEGTFDYVFSSHCLEHIPDAIGALELWKSRLRNPGGVLFLYLPHPDMTYWRPQWNRKHVHSWRPEDMAQILRDIGFINVIHSERDFYWSFSVVGFVP